jgi:hypothetical protein
VQRLDGGEGLDEPGCSFAEGARGVGSDPFIVNVAAGWIKATCLVINLGRKCRRLLDLWQEGILPIKQNLPVISAKLGEFVLILTEILCSYGIACHSLKEPMRVVVTLKQVISVVPKG